MYFSIHVLQLEVDEAGEEGKYTEISWLDLVAKEAARQRQVIKDMLYIPVRDSGSEPILFNYVSRILSLRRRNRISLSKASKQAVILNCTNVTTSELQLARYFL